RQGARVRVQAGDGGAVDPVRDGARRARPVEDRRAVELQRVPDGRGRHRVRPDRGGEGDALGEVPFLGGAGRGTVARTDRVDLRGFLAAGRDVGVDVEGLDRRAAEIGRVRDVAEVRARDRRVARGDAVLAVDLVDDRIAGGVDGVVPVEDHRPLAVLRR